MEKKTTKKAAKTVEVVETVEAAETVKKTRKACAKKCAEAVVLNEETAGCRAGDIYQTLAGAEEGMTVKEIVKATKATEQEILLGMGWLLREGKLTVCNDKVALA